VYHPMLAPAIVLATIATFGTFDTFGTSIGSPVMTQTQTQTQPESQPQPHGQAHAEAHAHAETAPETIAKNKAIVEAAFKRWSDGAGSPFELLADDATWTIVGRSQSAGTYRGREAFLRDVIRPFNARMREPLEPVIRRIVADGPMVVVFFDAKGVAKDGVPYVNTYSWFLELRDGRVIDASAFFDSIAFDELWTRVKR
jgi:uncharacterized protein